MSDVKRNATGGNGTDQTGTEKGIIAQNGTESSSNETNTEIEEEQRTPETIPTTLKATTQTTPEDTMQTTPEDTMQRTLEDTTQTTPKDTTHETPEDTTLETPEDTTLETPEDTTQTTPKDTTHETPEDTTLETPEDTTLETPKDTTHETPEDTTLETPEDITQTTPKDTTLATPEDTTLETPEDTTLETPEDTTQTTLEATMQTTPEEQVITNSTEKSRLIRIGYDANDNIKSDNINDFYEIREHSPNAYSDVKEFVKEKQSMSKVLSLLEEILKNMNSKKKFENLLLSNVIQTTPFDEPSIESIDDLPKKTSEELYVESGDNNFDEKMNDKIII
ncbi:unnamed protein product [Parnassius apollo]|uniref:(apollo) hypothetical protein n=1 Tax=Parnassius apollo TaxID=110799 RepID=A0A8S3W506_PARAO|nr:unnamed protein product [Parnassius apollo]